MKQTNFHTAITVHSIRWQNGRRFSTGSWRLSALSSMVVQLLMKVVTSLYAMVLMEKVSITSTGVGQIGAGESTGISQVTAQNNIRISTAAGVLTIVSSESKLIPVYSIGGQFITKLSVSANIPAQVNLRPGIYIVDGRKIAVK